MKIYIFEKKKINKKTIKLSAYSKLNFSSFCERYAPYPIPAGAASAATGHPHSAATSTAAVPQQTAHVQQTHQPQQTHQAMASAQQAQQAAAVAQPFPYGIPNVDMSSFQNVDWSNIYGMYV